MFSIFKKSPKPLLPDFSLVGLDMHSHLLPGIDDGSPDLETSMKLIKGMQDLGYKHFITSPHVMADLYPNKPEIIREKEALVKEAIQQEGLDISFRASAEYLLDEGFKNILQGKTFIPMPGNHVLFEMSFIQPAPTLHDTVFKLRTKGYIPIFAHPERYMYLSNDMENYRQIKDMGCLLQANILSFTGYYGKPAKEVAEELAKRDMLSFVGTDLHNERHLEVLPDALKNKHLVRLIESGTLKNRELVDH